MIRSLLAVAALSPLLAVDEAAPGLPEAAAVAAPLQALAGAGAAVRLHLRYDMGEPPQGGNDLSSYAGRTLVGERRPWQTAGYLVAPRRVLCRDPLVEDRFVERRSVAIQGQEIPAVPVAWGRDRNALLLELERAPVQAVPLAMAPAEAVARHVGYWFFHNGQAVWMGDLSPFAPVVTGPVGEAILWGVGREGDVVLTAEGQVVGFLLQGDIRLGDDAWRTAPAAWDVVGEEVRQDLFKRLAAWSDAAVFTVRLDFRSPSRGAAGAESGDRSGPPRQFVLGYQLRPGSLVVPCDLDAARTARLDRITVLLPSGGQVSAVFAASLRDWSALVVTAPDLPAPPALVDSAWSPAWQTLLPVADLSLRGEQRVLHAMHGRFAGWRLGLRELRRPFLGGVREASAAVFTEEGRLAALPAARREPRDGDSRSSFSMQTVPASALAALIDDLAVNADPSLVPLPEADENRLAWLGVEIQALNPELARLNQVGELTNDGRIGVLVAYVYPGSPAEQAGLQVGDVLVRLHPADAARPSDIQAGNMPPVAYFPWDRLDQVGEQYFERLPKPWPGRAQNPLSRQLTELGVGRKLALEYARDGQARRVPVTVEQSPPHFDAAPSHKSEALGLTVRELTFEVRRYFQLTAQDPGVIVSRIEPGSKCAVAGLKPFELITHIDDVPVSTVKEVAAALAPPGERRLSVLRMLRKRIVKVGS